MNDGGAWLVADAANVLSEVIDDEVMIIDMRLGNYYSLRGVGVTVWNALREPCRLDDVVQVVRRQHADAPGDVSSQVQRFLEQLTAEQLVSRHDRPPQAEAAALETEPTASPAPQPFETPSLEKYTDMQALLLVDPIHDVDELGWPNRAKPS